MATSYASGSSDRYRDLFIVGIRNAHALEKQALSILEPQVARMENYPEVAEQLRTHIAETHDQIQRLDEILASFGTSASVLKEAALSVTGTMAALAHSVAGDEILKNSFANYAFEHFEIAAYKSLLTMAEDGGFGGTSAGLGQSLQEEERMAQWIGDSLPTITRRYAKLYTQEGSFAAKV